MTNDKKKTSGVHKGHRQRMLNRYIENGINSFEEHEVLEMLLYLAYPQIDTNPKAHMLLDRFGSLDNLLNASVDELLMDVADQGSRNKNNDGSLTQRAATIISLIRDLDKYAKIKSADSNLRNTVLSDVYDVGRFCCKHFGSYPVEMFYMIVLDSKSKVKNIIKLSEGNVRSAMVDLEKIIMLAIKHKANGIILCHNHPGGNLEISNADKSATDKIAASLNTINIPLIDHIICCEDSYESMRKRSMILF